MNFHVSVELIFWSCIGDRQPTRHPRTGSQLSIIRWHLNLPLTLL